jgi:hypothetical protein
MMLIDELNSDEVLRRHGVCYSTDISIVVNDDITHFSVNEGAVTAIDSTLPDTGFSINGSSKTWDKFCEDIPPPEFHEPAALIANGHVAINGDMYAMQSNILYLRRLLEIWKESKQGEEK